MIHHLCTGKLCLAGGMLVMMHGRSGQNPFSYVISLQSRRMLHSPGDVFVPHLPQRSWDWLFGQQVTPLSPRPCTTWTPTSSTRTPWLWRLLGRSFRTTTATRCSPLWALEPNCPLMDGCHTSFHWYSHHGPLSSLSDFYDFTVFMNPYCYLCTLLFRMET